MSTVEFDDNARGDKQTSEELKKRPKSHVYLIFATVSLAFLMASLDMTIVSVALPTLLVDLKTNLALVGWTITGFMFSQSVMMPIIGKLSDEVGYKRVFLLSVAIFSISSLAAGFAPNIACLIIFRVIQGIGGGALLPSGTGIISNAFQKRRATAIGLFGSIFPIGGIIGPNLGGFIIDHLSWQWIFFVNVPLGILLLVMGIKLIPGSRSSKLSMRKSDITGISVFIVAILAILFAITYWANNPANPGITTWVLFAIGIIFLAIFLKYEGGVKSPIIDIKLLRERAFLAVNIYNFFLGMVIFGFMSFIPYYATVAYHMTAGQNGLLLTPCSILMIVMSAITSIFIIPFRYRLPMIIGGIIIAVSLLLLGQGFHNVWNIDNLLLLSILMGLTGIGTGSTNPAANNAALDLAPEKVAEITGMMGMARSIGGLIGVSLITLILSHYPDKAMGMQIIYMGFAVLMILLIPVVFLIPDTAYQRSYVQSHI